MDICHVGFVKAVVVAEGPSSDAEKPPAGAARPACTHCRVSAFQNIHVCWRLVSHSHGFVRPAHMPAEAGLGPARSLGRARHVSLQRAAVQLRRRVVLTGCHAGQVELPSCPVCLEYLDESVGIVTTAWPPSSHTGSGMSPAC